MGGSPLPTLGLKGSPKPAEQTPSKAGVCWRRCLKWVIGREGGTKNAPGKKGLLTSLGTAGLRRSCPDSLERVPIFKMGSSLASQAQATALIIYIWAFLENLDVFTAAFPRCPVESFNLV